MANDISNILHKILARGLLALREQAIMPRLVNGSYSAEAREKGDTIDVPIPSLVSAYDITPSPTQSSAQNSSPTKVQIPLDQWKGAGFFLTDKEMVEIDRNEHFIPMQMSEAVRSLANAVNNHIHAQYKGIYGVTGTAGTTPFASTVTAATNLRKVLHQQLAPRTERRGVLDFDAEANALALAPFADAEKTGSTAVKIEGEIGRKYGIDWFADDAVVTHTQGTAIGVGGIAVASATAAGSNTLDITASVNSAFAEGDLFTIAGDTQSYVVTASVNVQSTTATEVNISPSLKADASSEAITPVSTHVVNLGFHRDCFAFANRPLQAVTATNPNIASMTDPQTGITMRLELTRQYKQDRWELDILWGSKLVRAALGSRLLG